MQLLLRHKLLVAGATAVAAASAGGAYAATQSGTNPRQAFLNDVAKHLNVSPAALSAAVKAALIDRINAAVKDGKITQAQAKELEQRLEQGAPLPFLLGGTGRAFGPGHAFFVRRGGGAFHTAAAYLGLSNAQLMADLASGKSLAQVAKDRGKSVSGLEQTLITAETKRLNRLQSRGVVTKAQEQKMLSALSARIAQLVNRAGFKHVPFGEAPKLVPPIGPMPPDGPPMPPGPAGFMPAGGGAPPPPAA
jgi:hypothetical protein